MIDRTEYAYLPTCGPGCRTETVVRFQPRRTDILVLHDLDWHDNVNQRLSAAARVRVRDLIIDLRLPSITRDGAEICLTPQEWRLFSALAIAPERAIVTGGALSKALGYDAREYPERGRYKGTGHIVRMHIARLRRKLGPATITNYPGHGYQLQR